MRRSVRTTLVLGLVAAAGCAHRPRRAPDHGIKGPRQAELDLWRPAPDAPRIYVEAELGDGVPRMFMVDTGASLSVLTEEVANELGLLVVEQRGQLVGMSGSVPWLQAVVDSMTLGPYTLRDQPFAVGVPGVMDRAGEARVAGLLGNDVLGRFAVAIDYPANVLELARPGELEVPDTARPMFFDGDHASTAAVLVVEQDGQERRQPVMLDIDTGAPSVKIAGATHEGLEDFASEGVEAIFGIGPIDDLPASNFLYTTRRLHVKAIETGGALVEEEADVSWINYDDALPSLGPAGMPGLLGHSLMDGYRVILDYPGQRFALTPSPREPRDQDMHERALQLLRRPRDTDALRERARLLVWTERTSEALELLESWCAEHPDDTGTRILWARLLRSEGQADRALELLLALPVADLQAEHELVGVVNALWLAGRAREGLALAERAVETAPEDADAWVARADALRATGDYAGARRALGTANRIDENPDGHLLRRAWLSSQEGDLHATITHVRRLMDLYPGGGVAPWFYAQQVAGTPEIELLRADLDRSLTRLHPGDGSLDFLAAAYQVAGDPQRAAALVDQGLARDCEAAPTEPSRDNCEAWYRALVRRELDVAEDRINRAVQTDPDRAEFLDTLAVVREARGELDAARDAAWKAASLEPDDVYLLWQAERLDLAVRDAREVSGG